MAAKLWTPSAPTAPVESHEPQWRCTSETRTRLEVAIKDESESGLKGAYTRDAIVQAIRETWRVAALHELTEEQAVAAAERVEQHAAKLRAKSPSRAGGGGGGRQ